MFTISVIIFAMTFISEAAVKFFRKIFFLNSPFDKK